MAKQNTGKKTGPKRDTVTGRVSGGNPGNSGGKKGRSGRKPLAWKELCRDILHDAKTQQVIRTAAQTPKTPGYPSLLKLLADHSEGVPVQQVQVTTDGDTLDAVLSRMARAQAADGASPVDPDAESGAAGATR